MVRYDAKMAIVVLVLVGTGFGPVTVQDAGVVVIVDFRAATGSEWFAVNDGVMGGRSSSTMRPTGEGSAIFEGNVSLENNGGFASVRTDLSEGALAGSSRLVLRVRGDGKRYQLRLRTSAAFDGIAYAASFDTTADEWTTVAVSLSSFEPTFRGYRPRNAEALNPSEVRHIGIMVTDKQEGPFRLEVAWIGVD
jgi:monofunctional biosynthetic peptidoglycan transglycosylase